MEFCWLMGSDTSHTAIEAIGGLNLPGGGGALPPFEKKLRGVNCWSYVNKVSRIIRTAVKNPTEFSKEPKGAFRKPSHSKGEFRAPKDRLNPRMGHFIL